MKLKPIEKDALIMLAANYLLGGMKVDIPREDKEKAMEYLESLDCMSDDARIKEGLALLVQECHGRIMKKINPVNNVVKKKPRKRSK